MGFAAGFGAEKGGIGALLVGKGGPLIHHGAGNRGPGHFPVRMEPPGLKGFSRKASNVDGRIEGVGRLG